MSDVRRAHELTLDLEDLIVKLKEATKVAVEEGPTEINKMRRRIKALEWTLYSWGT